MAEVSWGGRQERADARQTTDAGKSCMLGLVWSPLEPATSLCVAIMEFVNSLFYIKMKTPLKCS